MTKREFSQVNYLEIPVTDPSTARKFFAELFGWTFEEWGPDYISFSDGRLDGGFRRVDNVVQGVLIVFKSDNLERDLTRVQALGASISKEIFAFPGGKRFHFIDPAGCEYAIWSEDDNR